MKYRVLGRTGIQVSELALGTMTFGAETDEDTAAQMLEHCRAAGINFIDTADVYSAGRSEELVGKLLRGIRDEMILATKVYFPVLPGTSCGLSRARVNGAVEASLKRLKTDRIDLYYAHYFDPETPIEEVMRIFDDLVREGKIRYPAVSNWTASQIARALAASDEQRINRFECVQPMYSLVKREAEADILLMAATENVAIVSFGCLAGGILTGKYGVNREPASGRLLENARYANRYADAAYYETADRLTAWASECGIHPATAAVAWAKAHPMITSVLLGARSVEQLRPQLKAIEVETTPLWMQQVTALSNTNNAAESAKPARKTISSSRSVREMLENGCQQAGGLTAEQVQSFKAKGFVGPLTLCSRSVMADVRAVIIDALKDGRGLSMRHLTDRSIYDVCCSTTLLDPIATILGPDLVIWRSRFIVKWPGAPTIPWHSDLSYHTRHLSPVVNVSAWLALDDVNESNACIRFIPGSQKRDVPHVKSTIDASGEFDLMAEPSAVDEDQAVNMRLDAGQFCLFDQSVLHGSGPNNSGLRRGGLSIRVTVPSVKVAIGFREQPVLVRGEDRYGINQFVTPPQDFDHRFHSAAREDSLVPGGDRRFVR